MYSNSMTLTCSFHKLSFLSFYFTPRMRSWLWPRQPFVHLGDICRFALMQVKSFSSPSSGQLKSQLLTFSAFGETEDAETSWNKALHFQVPRSCYERDVYPRCTQQGRGHRSREDEEATSGRRKDNDNPSGRLSVSLKLQGIVLNHRRRAFFFFNAFGLLF